MHSLDRQLEWLHAHRASEWIQILRQPSAEQNAAFVAWLKESPRHVRDFLLMLAVERALDRLDMKHARQIESLLAQAEPRVVGAAVIGVRSAPSAACPPPARADADRHRHRYRQWRWSVAIAAGLLAVLVAGGLYALRGSSERRQVETATSEQRVFQLEDGSIVDLNTRSRVAINFSRHSRDVRLVEGEALFKVHHDSARPFRVFAINAVVQAVGTQFDVYSRAGDTVVAVIEGRVSVTPEMPGGSALSGHWPAGARLEREAATPVRSLSRNVSANQEAKVTRSGLVMVNAISDIADIAAWRERRLVFQRQPLSVIVEELNRYSTKKIKLERAGVRNRLYSGVLDADDPESFLQVLARDDGLVVEQSNGQFTVRAR